MVDEANKGNTHEVKVIANDLKQNLEKIKSPRQAGGCHCKGDAAA